MKRPELVSDFLEHGSNITMTRPAARKYILKLEDKNRDLQLRCESAEWMINKWITACGTVEAERNEMRRERDEALLAIHDVRYENDQLLSAVYDKVRERLMDVVNEMTRNKFDSLYWDRSLKGDKWKKEWDLWFDFYRELRRQIIECCKPE